MTSADRSYFFKSLEEFQEERGEDSGPPLFAKKAVDQWRLWLAVQEAGGHAEVTQSKGWARIGRLFDPPKTMTDLSFRIKKIYEVHMLPFEKAVYESRIQGVYKPPRVVPTQQISGNRTARTSTKRASTGKAGTPGTSARPKRVRREETPARPGEELVGKVVKIYWPNEKRYFRGKVMAFDKDMNAHKINYDDGDSEILDLSEHTWHVEGSVEGDVDHARLAQIRAEAHALEDDDGFENESETDLAPAVPSAELPKDCIEDRVHTGRGYRVYICPDKLAYEIFCIIPGLSLDLIQVKAWESGKLLVTHQTKTETAVEPSRPLKFRIRLPSEIGASATQAIITLHGQLYIRAPIKGAARQNEGIQVPQGESAVQALPSETLEQDTKPASPDDEAAISPDRSNAISPEKAADLKQEADPEASAAPVAVPNQHIQQLAQYLGLRPGPEVPFVGQQQQHLGHAANLEPQPMHVSIPQNQVPQDQQQPTRNSNSTFGAPQQ